MQDPAFAPDPTDWLALDERERVALLAGWHESNPAPALHPHEADRLHAAMHAAVETQIAQDTPPIVAQTVDRLTLDGVHRHPAIHAVVEVLMMQMHASINRPDGFDHDAYDAALCEIDAPTLIARAMRRVAAIDQRAAEEGAGGAPEVRLPNRAQRRAAKKPNKPKT